MSVIEAEPSVTIDLDRARLGLAGAVSVASDFGREQMLPDYSEAVGIQLAGHLLTREAAVAMVTAEIDCLSAFMNPRPEPYSSDFIDELLGHHQQILAKEADVGSEMANGNMAYAARLTLVELVEGLW